MKDFFEKLDGSDKLLALLIIGFTIVSSSGIIGQTIIDVVKIIYK